MRFSKCRETILFDYSINNDAISSVSVISDLVILLDNELSFREHINNKVLKSFRMLSFIKRHSLQINDTKALTTLYIGLVRSLMEYNNVIWIPSYNCHIERLERVQRKFVN